MSQKTLSESEVLDWLFTELEITNATPIWIVFIASKDIRIGTFLQESLAKEYSNFFTEKLQLNVLSLKNMYTLLFAVEKTDN